jgi:hypothetical protein
MLVICDGMPRSASTWSYNVVLELLRRTTDNLVHGGYSDDTSLYLAEAPLESEHLVLKCHAHDAVARALLHAGAAKAVYTHREPAAAVESAMWMFGLDFETAVSTVEGSLELLELHRRVRTGLVVSYDEITTAPQQAVGRIATFLGVHAGPAVIDAVVEATSLGRVRQKLEELAAPEAEGMLVRHGESVYDPDTLLHPRHVRTDEERERPATWDSEQLAALERLRERYEETCRI